MGQKKGSNLFYAFALIFALSACRTTSKAKTNLPNNEGTNEPSEETSENGVGGNGPASHEGPDGNSEGTPDNKAGKKTDHADKTPTGAEATNTGQNTLIIGDSMSASGLGVALAKAYSEGGGHACQYSYSNSKIEDWVTGGFENRSAEDIIMRNAAEGNVEKRNPKAGKSWGLSGLLDKPQEHGCKIAKFNRLVIQLGTNVSGNEQKYYKDALTMAKNAGIKDIDIILPPGKRDSPNFFKKDNADIMVPFLNKLKTEMGLNINYLDSTAAVPIRKDDEKKIDDSKDFIDAEHIQDQTPTMLRWVAAIRAKFLKNKKTVDNDYLPENNSDGHLTPDRNT